jgi:hypothetical protein
LSVETRTDISLNTATGLTPEQARDARARAWAFVFKCWQEKQRSRPTTSGPDNARKESEHVSRKVIIPAESS